MNHLQPYKRNEKATRQQGSLLARENSSNGGKAIRTFWQHVRFCDFMCQGIIGGNVGRCNGRGYLGCRDSDEKGIFAFMSPHLCLKEVSNERLRGGSALVLVQVTKGLVSRR